MEFELLMFSGVIFLFCGEIIYMVFHFWKKRVTETEIFQKWGADQPNSFSVGELAFIKKQALKQKGSFQLDDITWNDLDMDEIYQRMNVCMSSAGDQMLYGTLRNPSFDEEEIRKRYTFSSALLADEKQRNKIRSVLYRIGGQVDVSIDALYEMGDFEREIPIVSVIMMLIMALCAIAMSVIIPAMLLMGILILVVNAFMANSIYKKHAHAYICTLHLYRYVRAIHALAKMDLSPEMEETYHIKECSKSLNSIHRSMFDDMYSADGLLLLVAGNLFLQEPLSYNRLYKKLLKNKDAMLKAIQICGELDTLISIASYRSVHATHCAVNFHKDNTLCAEEMVHPLLKNPVANDVIIKQNILISGSNASGKSTYLKMIACNCIFAQTFGFALAKNYQGNMFQVCTSMSLKDSLEAKDSYFVAEVRSIKRMMDKLHKDRPLLCMIDEILRGTNTGERIAAASEILMSFADTSSLCLAATHDIELTRILQNHYQNMHFSESLKDENMSFAYRLCEGPSNSRNAILLLKTLGFDATTVEEAQQMLSDYERSGQWMSGKQVIANEV